jgi:hypothetical protein
MSAQLASVDGLRVVALSQSGRRTRVDLNRWAQFARYGERIVYHRGELGRLPAPLVEQGHRLSKQGLIFLCHRRMADGLYAYEAVRISERTAKTLRELQEALRPRERRMAA